MERFPMVSPNHAACQPDWRASRGATGATRGPRAIQKASASATKASSRVLEEESNEDWREAVAVADAKKADGAKVATPTNPKPPLPTGIVACNHAESVNSQLAKAQRARL